MEASVNPPKFSNDRFLGLRKTELGMLSLYLGSVACAAGLVFIICASISTENKGTTLGNVAGAFGLLFLVTCVFSGIAAMSVSIVDIMRDIKAGRVLHRNPATGKYDWKYIDWNDVSLSWVGLMLGSLAVVVCCVIIVIMAIVAVVGSAVAAANSSRRRIIIEE